MQVIVNIGCGRRAIGGGSVGATNAPTSWPTGVGVLPTATASGLTAGFALAAIQDIVYFLLGLCNVRLCVPPNFQLASNVCPAIICECCKKLNNLLLHTIMHEIITW